MPRKQRVQVLLSQEELERFRLHARVGGSSLSSWLREAGMRRADEMEQRKRIESPEAAREFFARCDALGKGDAPEPDWDETKRLIADGKTKGLPGG